MVGTCGGRPSCEVMEGVQPIRMSTNPRSIFFMLLVYEPGGETANGENGGGWGRVGGGVGPISDFFQVLK